MYKVMMGYDSTEVLILEFGTIRHRNNNKTIRQHALHVPTLRGTLLFSAPQHINPQTTATLSTGLVMHVPHQVSCTISLPSEWESNGLSMFKENIDQCFELNMTVMIQIILQANHSLYMQGHH